MSLDTYSNFIAGEWVSGVDATRNINPSDTEDVIGAYAMASMDQTQQAIDAASAAFEGWSRSTSLVRAEVLDQIGMEIIARKDEMGNMLAREEGKTLREATAEAHRAGSLFKYFAAEAYRETISGFRSIRDSVDLEVRREVWRGCFYI